MGSALRAPNQDGLGTLCDYCNSFKKVFLLAKGVHWKMRDKIGFGTGLSIKEWTEQISNKTGISMDDIKNLITIDQTGDRNAEFGRLNIGLGTDLKREIMALRKKAKGRAKRLQIRLEHRRLEESQLEAAIPAIETVKHTTEAFIANALSSNVNNKCNLQNVEEDTNAWKIEEDLMENPMPGPSTSQAAEEFIHDQDENQDLDQDQDQQQKVEKVAQELFEKLKDFHIDIEIIKTFITEEDTKCRNALCKANGITKDAKKVMQEGRRMLKNRGYAKNSRDKKDQLIEDLSAQINELMESIKKHKEDTADKRQKAKELQLQALSLSKEKENMERQIHRQHQERISQRIEETWKFNYSREILPDVWWIPPTDE